MKIQDYKTADGVRLILDGELTIYEAASVKAELMDYLNANLTQEIEMDLSQVAAFDSAGLQLLLLAKRESMRLGVALRLVRHSRCVLDAFELVNIGSYFGDPLLLSESDQNHAKQQGAFQ